MRHVYTAAFVMHAALAPTILLAQRTHPDLSGKWEMDATQSEQGPLTPQAMTYTIQQAGDQLKVLRQVTTPAGRVASTLTYAVDGTPSKNTFQQGGADVNVTSTLTWEGSTLVIHSLLDVGQGQLTQTDRWTVAPDGKSMTIDRNVEMGGQQLSGKVVMVRQG